MALTAAWEGERGSRGGTEPCTGVWDVERSGEGAGGAARALGLAGWVMIAPGGSCSNEPSWALAEALGLEKMW